MTGLNARGYQKQANCIIIVVLFLIFSCNPEPDDWTVESIGTLQQIGITTWMYGTHRLVDDKGNLLFALRSTKVDLSKFENKKVKVKGDLVPGYATERPPFLQVTWLKKYNE